MRVRIVLLLLIVNLIASAQSENSQEVHWLSFEEAQERSETEPRPILVDIYTGWCGWCKKMEVTTYRDPNVVQYINSHFYPVKYDAETKDTIEYLGQTYTNPNPASSRSANKLTHKLLPQRRSYPSTIFMAPGFRTPMLYQGYITVKDISPYLLFFGDKYNTQVDLGFFVDTYKKVEAKEQPKNELSWESFADAQAMSAKDGKKTLVYLNNKSAVTSEMMLSYTLGDSTIAEMLKKDFHIVNFDVFSDDTITVNGHVLTKSPTSNFHSLVGAALKNNITFPTFLVFNKEGKMIAPVQQLFKPEQLVNVLNYFSSDSYKTKTFQAYTQALNERQ